MSTTIRTFEPEPDERGPAELRSARGALPLRAVSVRAEVVGTTAEVEVEQVFANDFDESLEVSYVFPLPDLAAVTRCEMRVDGRVVMATLQERGEAREAYANAVEAGKTAALAEQERPGVFTMTLGNLAAGAEARVRFAMAYPLPREQDRHVFRFPLVVAERYVPGVATAQEPVGDGVARDTDEVIDASRVSPPRRAPGARGPRLDAVVALAHGALELDDLECNMKAIEQHRERGRRVVRIDPDAELARDLVLRFRLAGAGLQSQLWTQLDDDQRHGTFELVIAPPIAAIRPRPRDIVIVLDRSGSMDGWKIVVARRAVARLIDTLDDDDRFAVFAFGSETIAPMDLPYDRLHRATARNRVRACEFSNNLLASGGTEMAQPLDLAVSMLDDDAPERDRWIVLITDGQVANEDALVGAVARTTAKIAAVGIDDAVNASLLRRLAAQTGGMVEYVDATHRLDDMLDRIHLVIRAPALERVMLEGATLLPNTIVPSAPLNVFPGVPLVVRGRYREALPSVRILARRHSEPFSQTVAAASETPLALRTCWAREQLLALEDRMVGEPRRRSDLATEMIALSLQHGVLSRFTAFVAIDERGDEVPVATRHIAQPVATHREDSERPPFSDQDIAALHRPRAPRTECGMSIQYGNVLMTPDTVRTLPPNPRATVHMLARLLWELLHGRSLFDTDQSISDVMMRLMNSPLPASEATGALASIEPVLRRALAPDPAQRHASPGVFARAVEEVLPRASSIAVARWLAAADRSAIDEQARWLAQVNTIRIPHDGYALIRLLDQTEHAYVYLAARATREGRRAYVLHRFVGRIADGRAPGLEMLCAAALSLDGVAPIEEVGTDPGGGAFRASRFLVGLTALQLRAVGATPPAIASAIVSDAAAALEAMLALPTASGPIALIPKDLAMSDLHIGLDGRARWTSLGIAPNKQYTAPYRANVPLAGCGFHLLAPNLTGPAEGRWQTIPRGMRGITPATRSTPISTRPSLAAPTPPVEVTTPIASPRRSRWRRWWQ